MPDGQPQTTQPHRQTFPQPAGHHLAQVNLARAVDDLDQPAMAEFMAALNKVNGIAERSPGFVWRQDDPVADARANDILADPRETYTLSVWETADALEFFAWGAQSWVCAGSNFALEAHLALWQTCVVDGDFVLGRRIMSAIMPGRPNCWPS